MIHIEPYGNAGNWYQVTVNGKTSVWSASDIRLTTAFKILQGSYHEVFRLLRKESDAEPGEVQGGRSVQQSGGCEGPPEDNGGERILLAGNA